MISTIGDNWVKGGNLTFLKVSPTLKGEYTCKAHNEIEKNKEKIGEAEAVVEIIGVYGKVRCPYFNICSRGYN